MTRNKIPFYFKSVLLVAALCNFLSCYAPIVHADNEVGVMFLLHTGYPDWIPRGVVDVGANVGGWTTEMQSLYPGVITFMVEASPTHTGALEKTKQLFEPNVDYKIAVLSSTDDDTIEFYSLDGGTGDSMFVERSHHYTGVKPDVRTTSKLDTVVKHMEHIDYLKLDVQGAELMVLSGATEVLAKTTFVQLEASVVEYNHGGVCWHEIDNFLRRHGFHLYDLGDITRNPDAFHSKGTGQLDILYIKPSSDFLPTWLVDNDVAFCGSSRGPEENELQEPPKETSNTSRVGNNTMVLAVIGFVLAFTGGYFVGSNKSKKNEKKR